MDLNTIDWNSTPWERVREGVAEPVAEAVTHTVGLMDALPDAEGQ